MYIYEGHMGLLYTSDTDLDLEDLHCEICGDYDWLIGQADSKEEAWGLFEDSNWNSEYLTEFINENFTEKGR